MTAEIGRYRYWGDQKPDTSRPLLTFTRAGEAVTALARTEGGDGDGELTTTTGTIRIYGPIDSWGGYWGVSAKEVAQALDMLGNAKRIVVRVNSPGGESAEGRAIMNLIRAHSAEITTVVDGGAYSAASYIAMAGSERVMSPGTTMMIHDTSTYLYVNAEGARKAADVLDTLSNSGAELYAEIAGGTVEEWRERQRAETWYSAATAVAAGLMQRVGTVPDLGPAETAGEEGPEVVDSDAVEERARAAYDLSLFARVPRELAPSTPDRKSAGGSTQPEGAAVVDFNDTQITALREQIGFPADADADTIVKAVNEALGERAEEKTGSAPQIPPGMSLVDSAVLSELQAGATAGRSAQATLATQERDREIGAALAAGKIAATSREQFEAAWDKDAESTKALLGVLTPGLVPTDPVGHESEPTALSDSVDVSDAEVEAFASQLGLNKEDLRG